MTGAVFVDLRKAFDTIDHSILFRKLHFLGIKGKELNWFENYLSSRIQVVGVGGASSDPPHITSGVPRGSILGPLLFVIHINDSPLCIKICNVLIYVDDTVLFCAGSNSKVIEDNLNQDLNTLGEQLQVNSLFLNTTKTEAMLFGTHSKLSKHKDFDIRHSLMLHWFADLMNVTEEVTIHRPNVSTLLSSAQKKKKQKPFQTLGHIFAKPKDPVTKEQRTDAIYSIPCNDCDHEYIGQTKRQFGTRLKEHQKAVIFCKKGNSALQEHTCLTNHTIGWDNSKIITTNRFYHQRLCVSISCRYSRLLFQAALWVVDLNVNLHILMFDRKILNYELLEKIKL